MIANNGYAMIDCAGLDLIKGDTPQLISGIYDRVTTAYKSGKPIFAVNAVWDTQGTISPIQLFVVDFGTYFICTSSTLQVIVPNTDSVTIVNMVGD